MDVELFIDDEGTIRCLHDDSIVEALQETGELAGTCRASFVEPNLLKPGEWCVEIARTHGSSVFLTGFKTRARALEVERQWLHHYWTTGEELGYDATSDKLVPSHGHAVVLC